MRGVRGGAARIMGYFCLHPRAYHRVCARTFRTFWIYLLNFVERHAPRLRPALCVETVARTFTQDEPSRRQCPIADARTTVIAVDRNPVFRAPRALV